MDIAKDNIDGSHFSCRESPALTFDIASAPTLSERITIRSDFLGWSDHERAAYDQVIELFGDKTILTSSSKPTKDSRLHPPVNSA